MNTTTSVMGGAVKRREDPALVQGQGFYVDDLRLPGMLHAAIVRSDFAKAKLLSVDTTDALAMPGVEAVYTAADVNHLGPLAAQVAVGKLRPLLADGQVNHVGEAIAMVVATDRYLARDAADAVQVDYEPLYPVIDLSEAVSDNVKVHEDMSNVLITWEAGPFGDAEAIANTRQTINEAKDRTDTVMVSIPMRNQRLIGTAIEPRAVVAEWNPGYNRFTIHSTTQIPHAVAGAIAQTFGIPYTSVRCIAPEVGGGFGLKLNIYNDEMLVAFASQQLGAPVKYTEGRRESPNSTIQGRGWEGTATVVGTRDGQILGYELEAICDMGAYSQNFTVAIPFLGVFVASGQYKFPTYVKLDCVATNAMTTDAYRGAGRPEAAYYLERIIDAFSREIGMDPARVRAANFIAAEEFPGATSPVGFAMDTGDYHRNLDALTSSENYRSMLSHRDRLRSEGKLAGVGISSYVEVCGFGPSALVDLGFSWSGYGAPTAFNGSGLVRVNPDGTVSVIIGTGPSGQGHQTTWSQIVAEQFGVSLDQVRVTHGDSAESPYGVGTFGSRSAAVDGAATFQAAEQVKEKAAKIAAHILEASAEDIRFADGSAFVAGSPDKKVEWSEIATVAFQPHRLPEGMAGGLEAHAIFSPGNATWPFGAHAALVTVDEETGDVRLLEYATVDDCGEVINPMIVDGQIHGGLAQGISQAMFEDTVYDGDGNLLTNTLVDYPLPTATDLPSFQLGRTVTPTDINPLGVKGIGEAGTIGSAQTVVNAVVDALEHLGVKHVDMPLRPKRVWAAIAKAKGE